MRLIKNQKGSLTTGELIIMLAIVAVITLTACIISADNLIEIDKGYKGKIVEMYGGSD